MAWPRSCAKRFRVSVIGEGRGLVSILSEADYFLLLEVRLIQDSLHGSTSTSSYRSEA